MPVYYTQTPEEDPVYHLWQQCPDGTQIEPENLELAALGRRLCDHCLAMAKQKSS